MPPFIYTDIKYILSSNFSAGVLQKALFGMLGSFIRKSRLFYKKNQTGRLCFSALMRSWWRWGGGIMSFIGRSMRR